MPKPYRAIMLEVSSPCRVLAARGAHLPPAELQALEDRHILRVLEKQRRSAWTCLPTASFAAGTS